MPYATPIAMVTDLKQGLLADFSGTDHPSMVYGMTGKVLHVPGSKVGWATAYGLVGRGAVYVSSGSGKTYEAETWEYFSVPLGPHGLLIDAVDPENPVQVLVNVRLGYKGFQMMGGPFEGVGRLKYIDGCSDSMVIGPPLKGDPCLNMLRFPPGIEQTRHTHPTLRSGLILSGAGVCRTARGDKDLTPGKAFVLYPDAIHAFSTADTDGMLLGVFHPDTDTGPSHEDHPMLNRTLVDGVSARDIDDIRTKDLET